MMKKPLLIVSLTLLLAASAVTVFAMLREGGGSIDGGGIVFLLWGISPYLVFFAAVALIDRFTSLRGVTIIACVISLLLLALTALSYLGTAGDMSSTYALIFIFVPIYCYVGSFVLLGLGLLIALLAGRKDPTSVE